MKILLLLLLAVSAGASPLRQNISFTQNWSRYPAPDAIIATLQQQFPHANLSQVNGICIMVTAENQSQLGQSNPLTGTPGIKDPNSAFLVWYTGCLAEYAKSEQSAFDLFRSAHAQDSWADYVTPKLEALCPRSAPYYAPACDYTKIAVAKRIAAIAEQIEVLVAPSEVLKEEGIAPSSTSLAARIDQQIMKTLTTNPKAFDFLNLSLSTSHLEPIRSVSLFRFFILLSDTLKY